MSRGLRELMLRIKVKMSLNARLPPPGAVTLQDISAARAVVERYGRLEAMNPGRLSPGDQVALQFLKDVLESVKR
jgi:hypothetical protein